MTGIPGGSAAGQATYTEELQIHGNSFDNRLTSQTGADLEGSVPLAVVGEQTGVAADCPNVTALQCYEPLGFPFTFEGHPTEVATIACTMRFR